MKNLPFVFACSVLLLSLTSSVHAQRIIAGQSLQLDNGAGTIVTIQLPNGLGAGPYTWTLPITSGGGSLSLPTPTTAGSILYSNGSSAWLENTAITATASGGLTAWGITDNGTLAATYAPNLGSAVVSVTNDASTATNIGESIANTGNGLTAIGLVIDNSGSFAPTKYDIEGTGASPGNWNVTSSGAAAFTALATNIVSDASGTYSMGPNDFTVIESGPSIAFVVLPTPTPGRIVAVRYNDASATDVLVVWGPPALIDGAGEYDLNGFGGVNPGGVTLVSDGTNWFAIGSSF